MYVHKHIYICVYHVHTCISICLYVYIHTHTHTHTHTNTHTHTLRFAGQDFRTWVAKNTLHPQWEEGMDFDLKRLKTADSVTALEVELWDWDCMSNNDLIVCLYMCICRHTYI